MDLKVEVVKVGKLEKHPNADTLEITKVFDYPVVVKAGDFAEGQLAAYVPIDAVVPPTEAWKWLHEGAEDTRHRRVRAKRLRGVYSEGLLIPLSADYFRGTVDIADAQTWVMSKKEGDDLTEASKITKYEPGHLRTAGTGNAGKTPGGARLNVRAMPKYTDIENIRRHPDALVPGEDVVIMEKIHGSNARYGWLKVSRPPIKWWERALSWAFKWKPREEEMFVVGSHNTLRWTDYSSPKDWHAQADSNIWHKAARNCGIEKAAKMYPGFVFFGEVFGDVQDLTYGVAKGSGIVDFRLFDVYDTVNRKYLDYYRLRGIAKITGLELAPVLYEGPWDPEMIPVLRDGNTLTHITRQPYAHQPLKPHIREGFVVRPTVERNAGMGRLILKAISPAYLTRKDGSEAKE